jgi:hypothetical protein
MALVELFTMHTELRLLLVGVVIEVKLVCAFTPVIAKQSNNRHSAGANFK